MGSPGNGAAGATAAHSPLVEHRLVAGLLLDTAGHEALFASLAADCFEDQDCRQLFQEMRRQQGAYGRFDLETLRGHFAGNEPALVLLEEISLEIPRTSDHLQGYATRLREDAGKRRTLAELKRATERIESGEDLADAMSGLRAAAPSRNGPRIEVLPYGAIDALPDRKELVPGVIGEGEMTVFFGQSGGCKSITALDLAHHLALGIDWGGRYIPHPLRVVYLLGNEGGSGLKQRIAAWRKDRDVNLETVGKNLSFVRGAVSLCDDRHLDLLVRTIAPEEPTLLIVDTVARHMGGLDENSTQDMGRFVDGCDRLRSELGCALLGIHHTGWGAKDRERGSYALRCTTGVSIQIALAGGKVTLTGKKSREGPTGEILQFELEPVIIKHDGPRDITSVRLKPCRYARRSLSKKDVAAEETARILRETFSGEHATIAQLVRLTGIKERTMRDYLNEWIKVGYVKKPKRNQYVAGARRPEWMEQ